MPQASGEMDGGMPTAGMDGASALGDVSQPPAAGQSAPIGSDVKRFIADTIRKQPNYRIPGQGVGESFNTFKQRVLGAAHGLMQKLANAPTSKILVPTSSQVIRLLKAWSKEGCPDDFSVSTQEMVREDAGKLGEIDRFFPGPSGQWEVTPFSPKTAVDFQPGLYFMRHGETDGVQAKTATAGQSARAQIIAHIRSGDYHSAREAAKAAAGHLSDDEISAAIDEALPGGQDADSLSPDELLNAATAASPAKRAELMPAVQRTFGNLSSVTPDGQHQLRSHLGRLGMRS